MNIGKSTKIYQSVNKFSLNCGNFDVSFLFYILWFIYNDAYSLTQKIHLF